MFALLWHDGKQTKGEKYTSSSGHLQARRPRVLCCAHMLPNLTRPASAGLVT